MRNKYCVYIALLLSLTSCNVIFENDISGDSVALLAPFEAASLSSNVVTFWWSEVENATSYQLQVVSPNFESTLELKLDTIVASTNYSIALSTGDYSWRVRALNSAYETKYTSATFTIDSVLDITNSTVEVIEPADDLNTNKTNIVFNWNPLAGATSYRIEVVTPEFNLPPYTVLVDSVVTIIEISLIFEEGEFTWRITGLNELGSSMPVSGQVIVDIDPPEAPALLLPTAGSIEDSAEVFFDWQFISDADGYILFLMSDAGLIDTLGQFASLIDENTLLDIVPGEYFWNVRAVDLAENRSGVSESRSLIVQ